MIRIMIVDDYEIAREGLKAILWSGAGLRDRGRQRVGDEINVLVDQFHPDVVLLDARLPGVSGAAACRRLGSRRLSDIKVLMVSTYSDDVLVDECIKAGASGYVIKDIERFNLRAEYSGRACRWRRSVACRWSEGAESYPHWGRTDTSFVAGSAQRQADDDPPAYRRRVFESRDC